jgi:hypothetical protein
LWVGKRKKTRTVCNQAVFAWVEFLRKSGEKINRWHFFVFMLAYRYRGILMASSLESRLFAIIGLIRPQIQKFQQASVKLARHDKILFKSLVEAVKMDDAPRVQALTNDLAIIRRKEKIILRSEIAVKAILAKVRNISEPEYKKINEVLMPAARILQIIGCQLEKTFPEMAHNVGIVREKISALIVDVGIVTEIDAFKSANQKADEMMTGFYQTVEQKMLRELLPLPALNPISL